MKTDNSAFRCMALDPTQHISLGITAVCFSSSLTLCRKSGSAYVSKTTAATRAALPIPASVSSIMSKQCYSCQYAYTDADACHRSRGNTSAIRQSALKMDSGRKVPCHTRESDWRQHCAWPFGQLSQSTPLKGNHYNVLFAC